MRKLLFLGILAVAIPLSSQAIARSDKSIGSKCYQSYHKGAGGNQVAACIQNECQQKHKNQNINFQIHHNSSISFFCFLNLVILSP